MTIKEIRDLTGLSRAKFAEKYNIPVGTIRDWEQEKRKCTEYLLDLLEFKVRHDLKEGN